MPAENFEAQGLEKNPNFDLAQWKFQLTTDRFNKDDILRKKLCDAIRKTRKKSAFMT